MSKLAAHSCRRTRTSDAAVRPVDARAGLHLWRTDHRAYGAFGLTAGDTYVWFGGEFGVEAFRDDISTFGTSLRAGVKPYWDLKTSEEAIDGYADINMFLNKQRTAAFKIGYRYGTPRSTLVKREDLDIGFALAF